MRKHRSVACIQFFTSIVGLLNMCSLILLSESGDLFSLDCMNPRRTGKFRFYPHKPINQAATVVIRKNQKMKCLQIIIIISGGKAMM